MTGLATALLAFPSLGYASVSLNEAAVGLILNEFDYLNLDQSGVEKFVEDYFRDKPESLSSQMKIKSYYFLRLKSDRSRFVSELARKYLLSTDFFRNGMDERKLVSFVGVYNPYVSPCSSPFSYLYYPQGAPVAS